MDRRRINGRAIRTMRLLRIGLSGTEGERDVVGVSQLQRVIARLEVDDRESAALLLGLLTAGPENALASALEGYSPDMSKRWAAPRATPGTDTSNAKSASTAPHPSFAPA